MPSENEAELVPTSGVRRRVRPFSSVAKTARRVDCLVIIGAAYGVVAIEVCHLKLATGDGLQEGAFKIVGIEVLIARALREQNEPAGIEFKRAIGRLTEIFV